MASLVFLVRKMPSHTSTLPRPKAVTYQFTNEHSVLCIFSTLESGVIAGYDIPPHVQVPACHIPYYIELGHKFEGLTPNNGATCFCGTPA